MRREPRDCWVDILPENELKRFSGKTDEELAVLARTDKAACEALILRCLKLIFIKSVSYSSDVSDRDDLCQEGAIALLKAIAAYDISRGVKFMTYAEAKEEGVSEKLLKLKPWESVVINEDIYVVITDLSALDEK